ncbi:MAG: hypothetical protein J3K34DRAFT_414516 [Monoraphidium minutum]|nr:MAG: hypothetical protein J3K34DRAFT_414516 [Monoraphidium minutum]
MEVDFRWVGQPNVAFFVELALLGPYTRLVPRVSNLTVRGTLRLALAPLVPVLPGFGAMLVSLVRTPQVKFVLDFGPALGGKFTARPVAAFLDPFLRDTLANMAVWPQRFVVPLLPREVTGPLDALNLRSVGVLQVEVLQARGLRRGGGWLSSVDPQVELFTQPDHKVRSSPKRATTRPKWHGEASELLVQEPASQLLRVAVYDIEMLNVKELLRVNLLKGAREVVRSSKLIGRASLPLAAAAAQPFQRREQWVRLSQTDWADEMGLEEEGLGEVQLALTYKPLLRQPPDAPVNARGVLFVDVRRAEGLPAGDWFSGDTSAYAQVSVAGQRRQTAVVASRDPEWAATFEFFNTRLHDTLVIKVRDRDYLKPDDDLGRFELAVKDLVNSVNAGQRGLVEGWRPLRGRGAGGAPGRVELRVQYRGYQ